MAKINLLPWREELRAQKNQEFGIIAGIVAGIAIAIVAGISFYYGTLIDNQEARNKYMQGEIKKLDKKIKAIKDLRTKKERLLQRITTIQELQTNRTEIVHMFDETVRRIPDGVFLTSLKQSGQKLTMTGVAESNTRVSEFISKIDESVWMTSPRINIIQRNKKTALQSNNFTLQLKQSSPKAAGTEEEG